MRQLVVLGVLWYVWRVVWKLGVLVGLFYWLLHVTQTIKSFGL